MTEIDLFEDVELQSPMNVDTSTKDIIMTEESRPHHSDPSWNDFVMSHFEEGELFEGRPTAYGLRRVAEILMGDIVYSGVEKVFEPQASDGDQMRSTVIWKIVFKDGQTYVDVADCWMGNTDDTFLVFSTATAATRAEGRALRKALRLKTVAAEEVTKKDTRKEAEKLIRSSQATSTTQGEYKGGDMMTDKQKNFIKVKMGQVDVNPIKFLKDVMRIDPNKVITKGQASDIIEALNKAQANKLDISNVTGYEDNWRNEE